MSESSEPTRYESVDAEPAIIERWQSAGLFDHSVGSDPVIEGQSAFSVAIPPPNVTGALHLGHALNGAILDALIRQARMRGQKVHWAFGTDHAGIATQTKVEQQLEAEGLSREGIGRDAFEERCQLWRNEYGGTIVSQFRRLGLSADFENERFTMDEGYVDAVQKVFVTLYEEGLIYRDNYMVNWDPGSQSAISDLEVEEREVQDTLYEIAYQLNEPVGSLTEIVVATVRPETLLADVAVAVNPEDERYAALVGKTVTLPLIGRELPVIADDYVKTDFGTGCLKITPGHDTNDFEIGQRHKLETLSCVGEDGTIVGGFLPEVEGMSVLDAREHVVGLLRERGELRAEEPYTHAVPFSHRSGERIEPLISLQWFMKMSELAAPAIDVVKSGKVEIHPETQSRRYVDWLENIRPWCVSRQLWWGHQIPVWYRDNPSDADAPQEVYCGTSAPEGEGWERDPDVLDTWFSSALWPFATLGWPEQTPDLAAFYPTSVLSTARDILFLWVARMVMMGERFAGDIPFSDVYNHSVIQAPDGRRMSKSLGTGVDPLELINGGERPPVFAKKKGKSAGEFPAYGADAVRFGLLAMSSTQDVRFSEEKIAQGKQLVVKLSNAVRFAASKIESGADFSATPKPTTLEDRWIVSQTERAAVQLAERIDGFEFSRAALGLYDFVYGSLCDWYLEFVKGRDPESDPDLSTTLGWTLRRTAQIAHPVLPFVSEDAWSQIVGEGLCAQSRLPEPDASLLDEEAEQAVAAVIDLVSSVRGWRNAANVPPGPILQARLVAEGLDEQARALAARLARLELVEDEGDSVTVSFPGGQIEILAGEHVDAEAERARVAKRREEIESELARGRARLNDETFTSKAPANVVQGARDRVKELEDELTTLG